MHEEKTSGVNAFCVGGVLIFVGSIVLCVVGMIVVVPYAMTRDWIRARCTVVRAFYNFDACTCNEDPALYTGCVYKYPCLQIFVTYVDAEDDEGAGISTAGRSDQSPEDSRIEGDETYPWNMSDITQPNSALHTVTPTQGHVTSQTLTIDIENSTLSPPSSSSITGDSSTRTDSNIAPTQGERTQDSPLSYDPQRQRKTLVTRLSSGWPPDSGAATYSLLYRRWTDAFYNTCSVYECGTEGWNIRQMNLFLTQYGRKHQSFICYHEPPGDTQGNSHGQMGVRSADGPHGGRRGPGVVAERTSWPLMLHAVLWPLACLLLGIALWLALCLGFCKLDKKQQEYEQYKQA